VKTVRIALFSILVSLVSALWAQEGVAYVSRLAAQATAQSVILTWKDAEGYAGAQYEVWRSDKEIVKDSLSKAKLLSTVKAGVEAFEDTTVTTPSFYLVLLKDNQGNRKGFYIPYRNKTTVAVKPDSTAQASTAKIKVGAVTYANPQVLIPFSAVPSDRKLVVFRRASAIRALADLKDATLLGNTTGAQTPYHDTPAPGLEFYYAILDAQAFADGRADAFQTENTTEFPAGFPLVAIPAEIKASSLDSTLRPGINLSTRALPLPRLQFGTEPESGVPLVPTAYEPIPSTVLPHEAEAALRRWSKATPSGQSLPPQIVLPEERSAVQEGAARYLVQIQKAYLEPKDWKGAVDALENVLKLSLDERTEARARFYLGESLANLKEYRKAFVEFLAARVSYPSETRPFLEALFNLLDSETD